MHSTNPALAGAVHNVYLLLVLIVLVGVVSFIVAKKFGEGSKFKTGLILRVVGGVGLLGSIWYVYM